MKRLVIMLLVACGSRSGLDVSEAGTGLQQDGATPIVDGATPDAPVPIQSCSHLVLTESVQQTRLGFDAMYVYFTDSTGTKIQRVPKAGGAVQTIATDAVVLPHVISNLVVDGDWIYWSSPTDSNLRRAPKAGGPVTTLPCTITRPSPKGNQTLPCFGSTGYKSLPVAIRKNEVFFGSKGEVLRMPLGAGEATVVESFDTTGWVHEGELVYRIEARDERVFWIADGVLFGKPLDGSPGFHVGMFDTSSLIEDLVVDDTRVFYSSINSPNDVYSIALDGSGTKPVNVKTMYSVIDGDSSFIYSVGAHVLQRTSKDDGSFLALEKFMSIATLRIDDCLYYTGTGINGDHGLIRTDKK